MLVRDLMTTNVRTCSPSANLAAAGCAMLDADCGILPVVEDDGRIIGVITDRDIAIAASTRGTPISQIPVRELVRQPVLVIRPDDDVESALEIMAANRVRRLPVVDEEERLQGIVSLNDAAARSGPAKRNPAVSYESVAKTLQAICRRRESALMEA